MAYPVSVILPMIVPIYGIGMYEIETGIVIVGMLLGYEVVGKLMGPDWDIVGMTKDEGRLLEIWVIGPILVGISTIYGGYFRRLHRSVWSHGPFLSTAIRYLFVFWFPLYEIYRSGEGHYWWFLFAGLYLGTCMADVLHWYLDTIKYKGSE